MKLVAILPKFRTLAVTMSHSHAVDYKSAFTVEELPDSQVKISGELPFIELESERKNALVAMGKNVELAGFRKGHVPNTILEKHLGEMNILAEMAERAIAHAYPHIITEHDIQAIGHPQIEVTKIAPQNPLGVTITVAVVPAFTLPDYKKIAGDINKKRPTDEVTDAELDDKIKDIQRQKTAYEKIQAKATANPDEAVTEDSELPESVEDAMTKLPKLTDDYVKTLGQPGQFETVADFKAKLREHLEIEKKQQNAAKHRADLTDGIIEKTTIVLPQILIDSEINQMFAQMQEDLDRANLKMEDYLTHIKKTREEMTKEWTPAAEMRAKLQLVLNEIAKAENITPDVEEVNKQTNELLERFKDADKHRVRLYVASVLMNEAVMKSLETK